MTQARGLTRTALAAVVIATTLLTGCGDDASSGAPDDGWRTMSTDVLTVAHPDDFTEAGQAGRGDNAALATRKVDGTRVATVSVQLDYMKAGTADMAASGAQATVQLGSTMKGRQDVEVDGVDEAKQLKYAFDSSGKKNTPPKGTRLQGTIVAGLDGDGDAFAVRIDYDEQHLTRSELRKIIDSIRVTS